MYKKTAWEGDVVAIIALQPRKSSKRGKRQKSEAATRLRLLIGLYLGPINSSEKEGIIRASLVQISTIIQHNSIF
jgi:hypothetical protein